MGGWMDIWMDGWVNGWMDGWMDDEENVKKLRKRRKEEILL
jgi:hypothetical protein